jgi:hypothetical protein
MADMSINDPEKAFGPSRALPAPRSAFIINSMYVLLDVRRQGSRRQGHSMFKKGQFAGRQPSHFPSNSAEEDEGEVPIPDEKNVRPTRRDEPFHFRFPIVKVLLHMPGRFALGFFGMAAVAASWYGKASPRQRENYWRFINCCYKLPYFCLQVC